MKKLLILTLWLTMVQTAARANEFQNYFRVWQGFQRADLGDAEFLSTLPNFMRETIDVYQGGALNSYIVVIPPANKQQFLPDELALLSIESKEIYQSIRQSPAGQAYGARHWDFFEKSLSKSADPLVNYSNDRPASLLSNQSYDMIGEPVDWSRGYTTVFIGIKKKGLLPSAFLAHLKTHIESAKTVMNPKGLQGYILIANENYEIAYLNWSSQEAHDAAGATNEGKAVFEDANSFMDVLMYQAVARIRGGAAIQSGQAYLVY